MRNMRETIVFGANQDDRVKISKLPQATSVKDTDFFVKDTKSGENDEDYLTTAILWSTIKDGMFADTVNRDLTVKSLSGNIDTRTSSCVVSTAPETDNSNNAASTGWVNAFWNAQRQGDVKITGRWEFSTPFSFNSFTENYVVVTDGSTPPKLAASSDSSIPTARLLYIKNLKSNAQEQLDGKVSIQGGTLNNPTLSGTIQLTKEHHPRSSVLIVDADNRMKSSSVNTTELECLKSVTSNIQTQINAKAGKSALELKADADKVVKLDGDQTIDGSKTFSKVVSAASPDVGVSGNQLVTAHWVLAQGFATEQGSKVYLLKSEFNTFLGDGYKESTTQKYMAHISDSSIHAPKVTTSVKNRFLRNNGNNCEWVAGVTAEEFSSHKTAANTHLPSTSTAQNGDKLILTIGSGGTKTVGWQAVGTVPVPTQGNLILKSTGYNAMNWVTQESGLPEFGSGSDSGTYFLKADVTNSGGKVSVSLSWVKMELWTFSNGSTKKYVAAYTKPN